MVVWPLFRDFEIFFSAKSAHTRHQIISIFLASFFSSFPNPVNQTAGTDDESLKAVVSCSTGVLEL